MKKDGSSGGRIGPLYIKAGSGGWMVLITLFIQKDER